MAKITVGTVYGEFNAKEVKLIKYALQECLNDWDISDSDERHVAEQLIEDLGD